MSLYLGIDIGGTKIAAGLVTGEGRVIRQTRVPTPLAGGPAILEAVLQMARGLLGVADASVSGIGVGTGGQVDTNRGVVVHASSLLPGWAGTDVRASLGKAFDLPCAVENDVNALAVGEARFGAGKGLATVVYLALGTGVGGALLLNGRVHHGAHWGGGEIGSLLLSMNPDARRSQAGEFGTLEAYASGPGVVETWRDLTGERTVAISGADIAAQAQADPDGPAAQAVEQTGQFLGYGLVSLANVLDPDLFVIGGGLASLGDLLLDPARRILKERALPSPAACPVVPAALGPDASLIGAASLAMPVQAL